MEGFYRKKGCGKGVISSKQTNKKPSTSFWDEKMQITSSFYGGWKGPK